MNSYHALIHSKIVENDFCLADTATTHKILKDKKYFQYFVRSSSEYVNTISGSANLIEGSGRAYIIGSE